MEIGYIAIRSNRIPLNDNTIRKAISYSINRSLISKAVSYDTRDPLRSIVPPNLQNKSDWLEVFGMWIICECQCEKMKLNSGIISQFLENIFNQ